jgi:hypothetical protein
MDIFNAIICVLHPVSPLLHVEAHLNLSAADDGLVGPVLSPESADREDAIT